MRGTLSTTVILGLTFLMISGCGWRRARLLHLGQPVYEAAPVDCDCGAVSRDCCNNRPRFRCSSCLQTLVQGRCGCDRIIDSPAQTAEVNAPGSGLHLETNEVAEALSLEPNAELNIPSTDCDAQDANHPDNANVPPPLVYATEIDAANVQPLKTFESNQPLNSSAAVAAPAAASPTTGQPSHGRAVLAPKVAPIEPIATVTPESEATDDANANVATAKPKKQLAIENQQPPKPAKAETPRNDAPKVFAEPQTQAAAPKNTESADDLKPILPIVNSGATQSQKTIQNPHAQKTEKARVSSTEATSNELKPILPVDAPDERVEQPKEQAQKLIRKPLEPTKNRATNQTNQNESRIQLNLHRPFNENKSSSRRRLISTKWKSIQN